MDGDDWAALNWRLMPDTGPALRTWIFDGLLRYCCFAALDHLCGK